MPENERLKYKKEKIKGRKGRNSSSSPSSFTIARKTMCAVDFLVDFEAELL
jgi:hypothetical protein